MGAVDVLLSSPIPVVLSIFLNVVLLAAGWFFVIPLIDRERKLQEAHDTLVLDSTANSKQTADVLVTLSQSLEEIRTIVERPVSTNLDSLIEAQRSYTETVTSLLKEIRSSLDSDDRDNSQMLTLLTNLERNSERLIRTAADISEKQSQVSGILIGMHTPWANNPRGV